MAKNPLINDTRIKASNHWFQPSLPREFPALRMFRRATRLVVWLVDGKFVQLCGGGFHKDGASTRLLIEEPGAGIESLAPACGR